MSATKLPAQKNPSLMLETNVAGVHTSAGHRLMLEACRAVIKVLGWDVLDTMAAAIRSRYTALAVAPSVLDGGVPVVDNLAPRVGTELNCITPQYDGIPTGTVTYQWVLNAATDIVGATSRQYVVVSDDIGDTIKCTVTVTNGVGSPLVQTTAATAAAVA